MLSRHLSQLEGGDRGYEWVLPCFRLDLSATQARPTQYSELYSELLKCYTKKTQVF